MATKQKVQDTGNYIEAQEPEDIGPDDDRSKPIIPQDHAKEVDPKDKEKKLDDECKTNKLLNA